jgi:hypothetical protein
MPWGCGFEALWRPGQHAHTRLTPLRACFVGVLLARACVCSDTIAFMNRYFAYDIKQLPVISGFKRRESLMILGDPSTASAIPSAYAAERRVGATYYGGLPDKIAPTDDMVSVDTMSLPGASIIIYNNWPREPTGTPAFITRYCQVCCDELAVVLMSWVVGELVVWHCTIDSPGLCMPSCHHESSDSPRRDAINLDSNP